jgi:hypothetical protein
MKDLCTVSAAMRLRFWLFLTGVACGLFIGLHV